MKPRTLLIIAGLILITIAWYLFRPERLFINARINEELPSAATAATTVPPVVLYEGRFHEVTHKSDGLVTIYRFADGKRVLRFTDFRTSNGPDVRVYLVAADDAKDNSSVTRSGFVEVGELKGNIGDQNYDLPPDIDLTKYRAVTIWCKRFSVNFATAPLVLHKQS